MLHNHTIGDIFTPSKTTTEGEEMRYWKFFFVALSAQIIQALFYRAIGLEDQMMITPVISVAIGLNVMGILK